MSIALRNCCGAKNKFTNGLLLAARRDVELAGYLIPKNTHVLANMYAMNMDSELWSEPDKFDPSRFLFEGRVKVPEHFIPFSVGMRLRCTQLPTQLTEYARCTGRRMCLGNVLTKMEVFLFLSSLVQKYELRAAPGERPAITGTVAASIVPKPFHVVLSPRKQHSIS